ncbi:MAG TPA: hypothetical protein PLW17_10200 [Limnochordia bacterium]|nr:hypothetical protein [Limnochordia bacterium]HPZ31804.1 hypothetical protein [Limnochordia bacterium]
MAISDEEAKKEIEAFFNMFSGHSEPDRGTEEDTVDTGRFSIYDERLEQARQKVIYDCEILRQAFIEFQKKTINLSIYPYMEPALNSYIVRAVELECLVKGYKMSNTFREKKPEEMEKDLDTLMDLLEDVYRKCFQSR